MRIKECDNTDILLVFWDNAERFKLTGWITTTAFLRKGLWLNRKTLRIEKNILKEYDHLENRVL